MEEALAKSLDFARDKAEILMEALPWIKEHSGKKVVIKCGGRAMVNEALKTSIASDIVLMKCVGIDLIIVHGGGPEITSYMRELGKEVKFVEGFRVTDKETMDIVKMVLVGRVNKEIVSLINEQSGEKLAVGVSGEDSGLVLARKLLSGGADLGFVGEVKKINPKILQDLIEDGLTPVVASVGVGEDGQSYNINADYVAGEIAAALKADKIIFLTNVAGLYKDFADKSSLISQLTLKGCQQMLEKNEIGGGMLPKVKGCLIALKAGVKRAHILNGTIPHAPLLEIFTDKGIGTMITP